MSAMQTNFKLAWRNLWRNKKRTLITLASIFFGVLIATVMSSMQEGSYTSMIQNIVKFYSGYIQIQHEDYWDNKTINNTFEPVDSIFETVESNELITNYAPRLESFALASSEALTRGSAVIGIDPEKENEITGLGKWVVEGEYLRADVDHVLVGSELAKYLELGVGDTLVLLSQGYHGVSAAGKYAISGLLRFPNPEMNKQSVYIPIRTAQQLYGAPNRLTSLALMVEDQYDLEKAIEGLRQKVGRPYVAMTWEEMHPELLQMVEADRAGAVVMKAILYILIGFGIFGTILMMVAERIREMGVMVAVGMQKTTLAMLLFIETILIGFMGVLAGFAGSVPVIAYYFNNPIKLTGDAAATMEEMGIEPYMYFSWMPSVFYNQVITIFVITAIIALYPIISALRLKVHMALHA
ncbi:MAG TPA: ABC transporter permease [Cytophagales bacterium]|jgi:ABC-type lipoprotein release transport system permease subunit|nr:ABC transporter permease [Cytophagales bacterium]